MYAGRLRDIWCGLGSFRYFYRGVVEEEISSDMRVLQLGPYPPPYGGVQVNLAAIREYLERQGDWCGAINLTRHRKPEEGGVYYPKSALWTLWLLFHLRFDVVHLHVGGRLTPRLTAVGFVLSILPRAKTVLTFHSGGYPSSGEGRAIHHGSFPAFVFRRFDRVIGVNSEIVKMFRDRFGVAPERLRLIAPHSLATVPNVEYPERLERFVESHRPLLTTVGGLEPEYDLPLQIDALGRILDRHPQAGMFIAGGGSLEGELRQLIASKPYADRILLWGDLPHPLTLRLMRDSAIVLRTTLYDGDSIAVHEALGLGTPVVATSNGMRPPGVRLIGMRDADGLCAAIEAILENPPARKPEIAASDENIRAVYDLYRELLSSTSRIRHFR